MLLYTIGDIEQKDLILTLYENQTTSEPVYVFSFVHVLTKVTVQFILNTPDDKSFWPERYNKFIIKPGELFTEPGEWHYKITEQQTGTVLEQGILLMQKTNKYTYRAYHVGTNYKSYRG